MAKWKLCRQTYGDEVYEFKEGDEITLGRGTQNTIVLSSLNISRKHCVIHAKKDEVMITDLKSANGIFVGLKKISPNMPFSLCDNDVIGIGWTEGAPLASVNDTEKYVFKLLKISNATSITDRIIFQNEHELQKIENEMAILNGPLNSSNMSPPKNFEKVTRLSLKRKSITGNQITDGNVSNNSAISQSSTDNNKKIETDLIESHVKKFKLNFELEEALEDPNIKPENEDFKFEAFNIKQECFDEEPILIDSDSESEQWYVRLSQNSPRKSINFVENRIIGDCQQDSSYSQLDEDIILHEVKDIPKSESDDEQYIDDLITILPPPIDKLDHISINKNMERSDDKNKENKIYIGNHVISTYDDSKTKENIECSIVDVRESDKIDSAINIQNINNVFKTTKKKDCVPQLYNNDDNLEQTFGGINGKKTENYSSENIIQNINELSNRTQLINTVPQNIKKSGHNFKGKKRAKRDRRKSSCKIQITSSQKEERKKKLRAIATKEKEDNLFFSPNTLNHDETSTNPTKVNAKVTASNRGAFLIDSDSVTAKRKKIQENKESMSMEKVNVYNDNKRKISEKSIGNTKTKYKIPRNNDRNQDNRNKSSRNTPTYYNKDSVDTEKFKECSKTNYRRNSINNSADVEIENRITAINEVKRKQNRSKYDSPNRELKASKHNHRTLSIPSPDDTFDRKDNTLNRRHSVNNTKDSDSYKFDKNRSERKSKNLNNKDEIENPLKNSLQLVRNNETDKSNSNLNDHLNVNGYEDKAGENLKEKEKSGENQKQYKILIPLQKTKPIQSLELKPLFKSILKGVDGKEPPRKSIKSVRFSEITPEVREFEIEQGNQMKKTSTAKKLLFDTSSGMPLFSLEKIALMRILRWNPQWLEEQNNQNEPPPILGHNNVPIGILHAFSNHSQYVELLGDLLLMEIWECLTQGYKKTRYENNYHQMRIESLPLVPPQRRGLELINISVNVSLPTAQANLIPREGEIVMMHFGEDVKNCRFFYVHNVRCLPSPPNNINSFYSISLQSSFTEKMRTLQRGSIMFGKSLAYINKDLRLFEAMEYLSKSPLIEIILNPQPRYFTINDHDALRTFNMDSQWTKPLNDSQKKAVMCAVSAAVEDRPRIHMVQGPPGTGKSRVICAILMSYFYDAAGKKQKNRGKILICATSNAAVDELVIRLLDIRQSLPHPERLNMVRVGRMEAMHARARDICSMRLAQRAAATMQPDPAHAHHALSAEISLLEAKINMWQSKATYAEDDARKAYCQSRIAELTKKIAMFRSGGGGGAGCVPELVAQAERRVLEGADVVLTTLASAHSHKMRGLARRIALCIVDEAGQAIEPETLVPLTLDVTRFVLIGDPQQLPGFICSQRARKHGLGESLFSRLSSCAETWGEDVPILLDRQYRMHPDIADYPNRAFYGGQVYSEPPSPLALPVAPYFVLGIVSGEKGQDATGANAAEAWGVARVALALRGCAPPTASLAVITPYAAQRELVRRHLRLLQSNAMAAGGEGREGSSEAVSEVEVNTVDSFQGQERDVVVVSLARSHGLGFLADAGRMNVMLTRARHALVLCLNPLAVEKNPQWRSLVEDAQRRKLFGILPMNLCKHPSVQQTSDQEILKYLSYHPTINNIVDKPQESSTRKSRRSERRRHRRGRRNHV